VSVFATPHYFEKIDEYQGEAFLPDLTGTCAKSLGTQLWPVLQEVDVSTLALGTAVPRSYEGVAYTALETEDGFSVIVGIDGNVQMIEEASGRVRALYAELGHVRMFAGLVDHDLGVACEPRLDGAGQLRCMPPGQPAQLVFANSNCQGSTVWVTQNPGFAYDDFAVPRPMRCDQMSSGPWSLPAPTSMGGCSSFSAVQYVCTSLDPATLGALSLNVE
jgi:hypothetical protein